MDWLHNSIGLCAHGQRDRLIEYKAKAFKRLDALMVNIQSEICRSLFLCALSRMARKQLLHNRPQTPAHETTALFQDPASLAESSNGFTKATKGWPRPNPRVSPLASAATTSAPAAAARSKRRAAASEASCAESPAGR
jgi:preprotein translocase subunit SecA